jgi:FkbM family methyltransferase
MGRMPLARTRYWLGTRRLDRRRRRLYGSFVRRGSLCFDVGAHVGDRTELWLRLGARVVAVEPQPDCRAKLRRAFGADPAFTLVEAAVGAEPGEAELRWPPGKLALASLSTEWTDRVRESHRFGDAEWSVSERVPVTTLDGLVDRFGLPDFCKIDIEGYEHRAMAGLSHAIPALSVEFTPEHLASTDDVVARLGALGHYRFNYSLGQSMTLAERAWLTPDALLERLRRFAANTQLFGDVYARLGSA